MKVTPLLPFFRRFLWISLLGAAFAGPANMALATDEILFPTKDAFIRSGTGADDNYDLAWLELAGRTVSNNRKIYLQFELPQNADSASEAKLLLTVKGAISGSDDPAEAVFSFRTFAAVSENPDLWNENEITWKNAPGNLSGPTEVDSPWVEVGTTEVKLPLKEKDQIVETVLPGLSELLKKETGRNLTLILVPNTQSMTDPGLGFYSRQTPGKHDRWPTLILSR